MSIRASRKDLLRLVDANTNRALEGLRVCEDVVRFCLGWAAQFRRLRSLRHALALQIRRFPLKPDDIIRLRDIKRDPGHAARSSSVRSVEHLLLINLQRAKEAIRVLEESSRLVAPRAARGFQRLRFRAYDVERDILIHVATLRHRR